MIVELPTRIASLEDFLKLPEFEPPLEYIGGRVIQKMSPQLPHSILQFEIAAALNAYARPRRLGQAYPELRGVFGGNALIPDIAFFTADRVPKYRRGQKPTNLFVAPDLALEIYSPGQTVGELRIKIRHSLRHGTKLGWLIHPQREIVQVIRPRQKAENLKVGDVLSGEDVLPGFSLPLAEIFGWLEQD